MKRQPIGRSVSTLVCLAFCASIAFSQTQLKVGVFGSAGHASATAAGGTLQGTLGQDLMGATGGGTGSMMMGIGFWKPVYGLIFVGVPHVDKEIPSVYRLYQNFPNPFNPSTRIRFDLPRQSQVRIEVYDMLGRVVATLVNDVRPAGSYEVDFNAARLASGAYICRIQAESFIAVRRLMVLK